MLALRCRLALGAALCALGLIGFHGSSYAQWAPDRLVTIVVPFNAGGGADAIVRPIAAELARIWAQPVIVENRPGADTAIGTRRALEAKPDGLTLLLQVPGVTLFRHVPAATPFDPLSGLVPVTALTVQPPGLVVNSAIPGKTLAEVFHHCKTAKQPCSFGTLEKVSRLQARAITAEAGLGNVTMVRYRGSGQMITDVATNTVNMAIMGLATVMPHYRAGTLKILAVDSKTRVTLIPEVPTGAEAGYPIFSSEIWYGLFAPKGTSTDVLQGIAVAVREALKADSVKNAIAVMGAEPVGNTPSEFAASVQATERALSELARRFPLDE